MSRFLDKRFEGFKAYEAGEQPGPEYIRLNTNESPFPPSPKVRKAMKDFDVGGLRFYSDPFCTALRKKLAEKYDVEPDNVLVNVNLAYACLYRSAVHRNLPSRFLLSLCRLHSLRLLYGRAPLSEAASDAFFASIPSRR